MNLLISHLQVIVIAFLILHCNFKYPLNLDQNLKFFWLLILPNPIIFKHSIHS